MLCPITGPNVYRPLLNLLGTPALVALAHVRGGLDRGNKLQGQVAHADESDDRASNVAQHVVVQQNRTNEDVD